METKQDLENQAQDIRNDIAKYTNLHYNGTANEKATAMDKVDELYAQLNVIVNKMPAK